MLNQSSQHAVRAMAHLALAGSEWVRARDLAEAADVPFHYLAKLLGQLVRVGALEATRGKHGGYRLAKPAEEITLFEVIDTIEPLTGPRQCLLSRRDCDGDKPCAIHDRWAQTVSDVYAFLQSTTLADIVNESEHMMGPAPKAS